MQVKDFSLLMVNGREELVFSKQNRRKKVDFGTCLENQMFPILTSSPPLPIAKEAKVSQELSTLDSSALSLSTTEKAKTGQELSTFDPSSPLPIAKEAETGQLAKETFLKFFSEIISLSKEMNEKINSLQMNFLERGQLSGVYPLREENLKDILTTLSQEEKETLFKELTSANFSSRELPTEPNQRIISQILWLLQGKESAKGEMEETLAHLSPKEEVLFSLTGQNRENPEKIGLGQEETVFLSQAKASQEFSALNSSSFPLLTAKEAKASQQLSALNFHLSPSSGATEHLSSLTSHSFSPTLAKEAETDQLVKETFSRFFSEIISLSKEMNEKINSLQMNFLERGQLSGIYPLTEGNLKDILTTLSQKEKETLFKEIASASLSSRKLPAEPNQRIISQILSFLEGKESAKGELQDTLAHLSPKEEVLFPLAGENRENAEKIAPGQEEIIFSVKQRSELANQILERINLLRAQNHNEARIVLRPKSLGDVHLHLYMHKNNLTLQIEVLSQKTAEIIRSDFTYLEETLKKEGVILKEFTVSLNQNSDFDRFEGQMKNPFYSSKKTLFPKTNVWSEGKASEEEARSQVKISSGFYYIDYLV